MNVHFISLGCDKNLVDSEVMLGILAGAGHAIVNDEREADVIVVNTCGFIADAAKEGVDTILEAAALKKAGRLKALVVAGCLVQRYKDDILNEMPEIDAIVGVGDFEAIGRVVDEAAKGGAPVALVTDNNRAMDGALAMKRLVSAPNYYAYLKIAEGCDNCCTYCTIPSIRGNYRSRSVESLADEARMLAEAGVSELILVAQDTAKYGLDLYGSSMLHVLLRKLSHIEGIKWLRVLYAYPEHLTDETINEMAANPKVCHYLDMPVQHGANPVLKQMGRRSSRAQLDSVIEKLRAAMPDIALRTTLIVGFPGETDADFKALLDFVTEKKFDKLGVFEYSKEEGTAAAKMGGQIPKAIKTKRRNAVMRLQKRISAEKLEQRVGQTVKVIVDGKAPGENLYIGRAYTDSPGIDGSLCFEYDGALISGSFVSVKVTGFSEYDLFGVFIDELAE